MSNLQDMTEALATVDPATMEILLGRAYAGATASLIGLVAVFIISFVGIKSVHKASPSHYREDLIFAVYLILFFVGVVVVPMAGYTAIIGYLSPEYVALQLLMEDNR